MLGGPLKLYWKIHGKEASPSCERETPNKPINESTLPSYGMALEDWDIEQWNYILILSLWFMELGMVGQGVVAWSTLWLRRSVN